MEVCHQADLLAAIRSATDHYGSSPNSALQVCLQIQHRFSCVPETSIPLIAAEIATTTGHIRSVITFYSFLHETPRGVYDVYSSDSITYNHGG
jgi:[NiFe] hydrogenase diaphorase moiety large subunit